MRIRATAVAATGALALSAFAVPAARAVGGEGDTRITKVVVGGDNLVPVGTSAVTFDVSVTATDDSGIKGADAFELHGPGNGHASTGKPVCTQADATTSTCTASVTIDPKADHLTNANAGTWYVDARVDGQDGGYQDKENAGFFYLQRTTRITTADATPEPVRKGDTVTAAATITRVDWETLKYEAYRSPDVSFGFRRKGGSAYAPLPRGSVRADSQGRVKATAIASLDGYFRFSFKGASTSARSAGGGDFVDVRGATATDTTAAAKGAPHGLDVTFQDTRLSGGNITVGTTTAKKTAFSFTLRHGADVDIHAPDFVVGLELYRGGSLDEAVALLDAARPTCVDSPSEPTTLATCTATLTADPAELRNDLAGVWETGIYAIDLNGQDPDDPEDPGRIGLAKRDSAKDFPLYRFTKLTADAAPEPVKEGGTITVTGRITRASWDDGKYHGFSSRVLAVLEYRKKTESSYTRLKSAGGVADGGHVTTTTPATYDGYYRLTYPHSWITPDVVSPGDYVDVQ
ncbi:hypothetical protein [Streptomyces sp. SP2-10]|uniref:hypothetical protein n=1 Tax=Streptomyces sp. SP2-10 TaxID=2873385 RepID=UPI0027DFF778|nr:hypothetical protein [Streptomyces sp. SP2-10]